MRGSASGDTQDQGEGGNAATLMRLDDGCRGEQGRGGRPYTASARPQGTLRPAAHNAHVSKDESKVLPPQEAANKTAPRPVRTAKDRSVVERRCMVVLVCGAGVVVSVWLCVLNVVEKQEELMSVLRRDGQPRSA
jgi:hypothetical protein